MGVFKINIQDPRAYLHAISGITRLTPRESELLGEIVSYMQLKKINVLDDNVRAHVIQVAGFEKNRKPEQGYYNLISSLKKKKLILNSHRKMQLKPILFPGTVLQIAFSEPVEVLKEFEEVA